MAVKIISKPTEEIIANIKHSEAVKVAEKERAEKRRRWADGRIAGAIYRQKAVPSSGHNKKNKKAAKTAKLRRTQRRAEKLIFGLPN